MSHIKKKYHDIDGIVDSSLATIVIGWNLKGDILKT